MKNESPDEIRDAVRQHYAQVAGSSACAPGCCGANPAASLDLGYSEEDLAAVPEGANMGLGCGNPQAMAALRDGETVLDLGSGGGFDCFLAARRVGPGGRVIGVDMTAEMVAKARANARQLGLGNVEFRLGEIEHLPVEDSTVDVILSNCVINLSPDKAQVFREAWRVLKPGGRLAVADVVATADLPEALRGEVSALTGCVAGAAKVAELEAMLRAAGFASVRVAVKPESREVIAQWFPGRGLEDLVASATLEARKAEQGCCGPSCCA